MRAKRPNKIFKTNPDSMELYATRALAIPFANSDSAGRLSMVASAVVHTCIPIETQLPYCDSSLSQDIFAQSYANVLVQNCVVKLIDAITFDNKVCYIYSVDDVVDILEFTGYTFCQDFTFKLCTDFENMAIGETINVGDDAFAITRLSNYDTETQTMGIGRNCVSIYSVSQEVEEDGLYMDVDTASSFASYRYKEYKFTLSDTFIKSNRHSLLPKPGETIDSEYLLTLSRMSKVNILVDNTVIPSGEDDAFYVKPNSVVHSVDIRTNMTNLVPELKGMRDAKNEYMLKVFNSLSHIPSNLLTKKAKAYKSAYRYNKPRVGPDLLKNKCIITITLISYDLPKVGYKFTGLHGNKGTLNRIYPNGAFKDERGININIVFSTNSVIKRENYGTLKEKWINAITLQLKYLIDNKKISKSKVFKFVNRFMELLGLGEDYKSLDYDEDSLYEFLQEHRLCVILPPFSNDMSVKRMLAITKLAKDMLDHKLREVYYYGRKLTDKHEVGDSYVLRLINDVNKGNQFSGYGETDSRGYLTEDDNSAKDGKSAYNKKSAKMSDIALNVEIQKLPPKVADKLLNTTPNYALNELANSCGYGFGFESVIKNSKDDSLTNYYDEEIDDDDIIYDDFDDDDDEYDEED